MKSLPILDCNYEEKFERAMRVYMVKSESEFTRLAKQKYLEEIIFEQKK